ncbi:MAG: hypothetical protein HGB22_01855 [Chlorobiaceae bacterium]|nr:hypothetical protein [Chlorobiaceae bacterium]
MQLIESATVGTGEISTVAGSSLSADESVNCRSAGWVGKMIKADPDTIPALSGAGLLPGFQVIPAGREVLHSQSSEKSYIDSHRPPWIYQCCMD